MKRGAVSANMLIVVLVVILVLVFGVIYFAVLDKFTSATAGKTDCGGLNQKCCTGNKCSTGYTCDANKKCVSAATVNPLGIKTG